MNNDKIYALFIKYLIFNIQYTLKLLLKIKIP